MVVGVPGEIFGHCGVASEFWAGNKCGWDLWRDLVKSLEEVSMSIGASVTEKFRDASPNQVASSPIYKNSTEYCTTQ